MLPLRLREKMTQQFYQEYSAQLGSSGLMAPPQTRFSAEDNRSLEERTIQSFGFEWREYSRFGWDDPVYDLAREKQVFLHKSLLDPAELEGKVVLDAGCGNGRYAYWAASYGSHVIALDLGDGVESASKNTAEVPGIQVVQADIFALPFAEKCFDTAFAIGVLMHTGDARKASGCLASKLKPGGSLTVHVYGRGNPIYELVDGALRRWTTRMSIPELQIFTRRTYALRRFAERLGVAGFLGRFVRLDPHPHCIFDWYSAPCATHHTYPEVCDWFAQAGLAVVATNERSDLGGSTIRSLLRPVAGAATAVTVRGRTPG